MNENLDPGTVQQKLMKSLPLNVETAKQAKEVEKEARRGRESNFNMVEDDNKITAIQMGPN